MARLVPEKRARKRSKPGSAKGKIITHDEFYELCPMTLSTCSKGRGEAPFGRARLPLVDRRRLSVRARQAIAAPRSDVVVSEHAVAVRELPRHQRDPFDGLPTARSRIEGLALATAEPAIGAYEVNPLG